MVRRFGVPLTLAFVLMATLAHAQADAPSNHAADPGSCGGDVCVPTVTASIEVGPEPWSVVSEAGSIWVGNDLGVARIDPATNGVQATIPIGGVVDVAAGDGQVWVASYSANSVGRVDLATNTVPQTIDVDGPSGIAVGEGGVWVVSPVQGTVTRIDPATSTIVATIVVAKPAPGLYGLIVPGAGSIAVGDGAVWATMENSGKVARIDPSSNRVVATIGTGSYPSVAFADGALWVMSENDPTLRRIDPATNRAVATIPLHTGPLGPIWLSVTEGALWVTGDRLIARIDTSTNAVASRLLADDGIYAGVATVGSDLWLARLATNSNIGSYDPDSHVLRASVGAAHSLPVHTTWGVPYTQPVPCGRYTSPSGTCTLQADVYSRAGALDQPVIVLAHGGSCLQGCRSYLGQLSSALSLEGAVVFNVDVRQGSRAAATYHDLACAVRFARANATTYGGDPARVTLVGHSMGSQRGPTVALAGDNFTGGCLAGGSGTPDGFVGMSGGPSPGTRSYIGRNPSLTFRYVSGSAEDPSGRMAAKMRAFVRDLRKAGYDATYTLVDGADHYSTYTPGTASPTLQIILRVARNP